MNADSPPILFLKIVLGIETEKDTMDVYFMELSVLKQKLSSMIYRAVIFLGRENGRKTKIQNSYYPFKEKASGNLQYISSATIFGNVFLLF